MGPVALSSEPEAPDAQAEVIPITWELLRQLGGIRKGAPTVPALSAQPYKIGMGDSLRIHVFGQPEFSFGANQPGATSTNVTVSGRIVADDGTVFVPLVGKVELTRVMCTLPAGARVARLALMLLACPPRLPAVLKDVLLFAVFEALLLAAVFEARVAVFEVLVATVADSSLARVCAGTGLDQAVLLSSRIQF